MTKMAVGFQNDIFCHDPLVTVSTEAFTTEFVSRMRGVVRAYGTKIITDALRRQGFNGENEDIIVKKLKTYIAGLYELAKQDKDDDSLSKSMASVKIG